MNKTMTAGEMGTWAFGKLLATVGERTSSLLGEGTARATAKDAWFSTADQDAFVAAWLAARAPGLTEAFLPLPGL